MIPKLTLTNGCAVEDDHHRRSYLYEHVNCLTNSHSIARHAVIMGRAVDGVHRSHASRCYQPTTAFGTRRTTEKLEQGVIRLSAASGRGVP
jgi:hypothetical protein